MIFLEFNEEWFMEQHKNDPDKYPYYDEAYVQLVDSVMEKLGNGMIAETQVKVEYPDGLQTILPDDVLRQWSSDTDFISYHLNIWKHRYVMSFKGVTEEGKITVDAVIDELKAHPSFIQINHDMSLIGILDPLAEQCKGCGGR